MSHFGRAGPPDIRDTYSLLVLNITFRSIFDGPSLSVHLTALFYAAVRDPFFFSTSTFHGYLRNTRLSKKPNSSSGNPTLCHAQAWMLNLFRTSADDLYPLFDRYGKVVDIFIPRDRRTGESRGFAFVRYKYADEAQKAIERLDGRAVDGRNIVVQSAKYGRNDEPIQRGRITDTTVKKTSRSRSRSPRRPSRDRRYRDDDRHARDTRRRSRSRDRNEKERYRGGEREEKYRGGDRERERGREFRRRSASRSMSRSQSRSRGRAGGEEKRLARSASDRPNASPRASPSKGRSPRMKQSPGKKNISRSPSRSLSRSPRKRSDSEELMKEVDPRVEKRSPLNTAGGSESPDREPSPRRRVSVSPRAGSRPSSPLQGSMSPGQRCRIRSPDAPRSSLSPAQSDGA